VGRIDLGDHRVTRNNLGKREGELELRIKEWISVGGGRNAPHPSPGGLERDFSCASLGACQKAV